MNHDPLHPTEPLRRWRAARNILLVRLDNLGDVVMSTPAFAAVRHTLPQARLTLLASRSGAAALAHVPMLDDVIVYDAPWSKGSGAPRGPESVEADRALIGQLAERRFDAAIIFTVCTQSALPAALMCRLAGIPLRLAHARENPYDLLSDWVRDTDSPETGMRHEVARQLALVAAVGLHPRDDALVFRYRVDDVLAARAKLAAAGGDPMRPYFIVHPGATAPSRRYPAARFGVAAQQIVAATGCQPVFTGGADEQALVDEAAAGLPGALSLAGQLSLGEFAALLAGAQVLVSNNTGPVHMAAALGTPVVDLYALTNPQHTPWKVRSRVLSHDVPCRNCFKSVCPEGHNDCLHKVEPQAVAQAAQELMGQPGVVVPLPVQARVSVVPAL
ncbi:lipopolysaccharide heptosyltransferase II [Caldimonas tepidiphila]|uniref:lipopolysaccharide heptosyltransferase II n=1 Tax=Caldimonas tepidiphila TaxID=2315841 RepID=UPI000E5A86D1|nr:lipopolysaccharide heptosyltransferase II [Caldimonas tepidiphila]